MRGIFSPYIFRVSIGEMMASVLDTFSLIHGHDAGPTRIDGGGPWNYKPIRRHRKLKKYRRNAGRR